MKIFLDIDGVMVHAIPSISIPLMDDGFYKFNNESVSTFNLLTRGYEHEVILSSSHRFRYTNEEWVIKLKRRGLRIFKLTIMDESTEKMSRKMEIYEHILNHKLKPEEIIVIDDDKSLNSSNLKVIHPSPLHGLRFSDIK